MASMPTQDEFLAATRKSQEAMIAAIRTWFETVRTATPKLTSVYAPLTDRLPKLPTVSLPFADKLPTPEQAVDNAYHMAEQLLANQRKFTEDLLDAMTPLMPGRTETAPKGNGSHEPKVPGHQVWQEAVAGSEAKPAAVSEAKPAAVSEAKPAGASEAKPAEASQAKPAAARSTAAKSGTAKSGAAKSTAGTRTARTSAPKRTPASRAPKGTDAR